MGALHDQFIVTLYNEVVQLDCYHNREPSLLALYAVPHTECVVLYNEVVQLDCFATRLLTQSRIIFRTTKLCG